MNDQQRAAMQMALEALERLANWMDVRGMVVAESEREAITALREALEVSSGDSESSSGDSESSSGGMAQPQCNQHPDAPHGFDRNASHSADRYVCECESWEPPQGFRSLNERIAELEQDPKMKAALDRARERFADAGKVIETSDYDREFWGDGQDHSEQHLNMVQGEPIGWMWRVHGWIVSINGKHRGIKTYIDLCRPPNSVIESDEFIELLPVYTTPPSVEAVTEAERKRFKKIAENVLGWVYAGDRDKPFNDADFVGEMVRIRLTGLTELAEIVKPGCREAARKKFTEECAAAIRSMK